MRDLAWVLATHPNAQYRNGAEAVSLAETAKTLSPNQSFKLLDVLAASYAEAGQFLERRRHRSAGTQVGGRQ